MHDALNRLFFYEHSLKVNLRFDWKGGIRSGKYVLVDAWKPETQIKHFDFPDNWRLTKNDRDFIEEELDKEKEKEE